MCAFFRQVKFQAAKTNGPKRVAEEVIVEVEDMAETAAKQQKFDDAPPAAKPIENKITIGSFKKPQTNRNGFSQKSALANLVKRKPAVTATATAATVTSEISTKTSSITSTETSSSTSKPTATTTNALSLLSGYDNCTDSDDSD